MISEKTIKGLKEKFSEIHPLIFHRSLEKIKSGGDLFDVLDMFPKEYPVIWNEEIRKWVTTKDLFQAKNFSIKDD